MRARAGVLRAITLLGLLALSSACLPGSGQADTTRRAAASVDQVVRLPSVEPTSIDPGLANDVISTEVIGQLFEGLVAIDDNGNIYGVEAEAWSVSDDGLTYTFQLRDGLRWSDGQPLTARDYEYAWKRNIDPATGSEYASNLYPIRHARRIHLQGDDPRLLGVRAADRRTLVVELEQPAAYFLRLASLWTLYPLPRWAIERAGARWTEPGSIVTNGPFTLAAWEHQRELVLVRNDAYWGPRPTLARAVYRVFPEGAEAAAAAAYAAGELDLYPASYGVSPADAERVRGDPTRQQELRQFAGSGTHFIIVNHRRPPLRDRRVRLALGMALDRERLVRDVLQGAGRPASSLQPEGIAGRRPELWPAEDAQGARELLADAGYAAGRGVPELSLTYRTGALTNAVAEYLQQQWQETLGIRVRLERLDRREFFARKLQPGWTEEGDLKLDGWVTDYDDPYNWFNELWDSASDPRQFNGGWQHPYYNQLVRLARVESDRKARLELYEQAEAVLAQTYAHIPLYQTAYVVLVKPYVQNVTVARIGAYTPLAQIAVGEH